MMKSIVCDTPGSLRMEQGAVPVPAEGEVLLRIRRVGICGTDMHIFRGTQPFLSYPRVMGHELSGHIHSAPAGSRLAAGDQVYVMPYLSCGTCVACRQGKTNCCTRIEVLGVHRDGGMTEYLALPERFVFKTEGISLDDAAMIEFLAIGAHAVKRGAVDAGKRVLVVGAFGLAWASEDGGLNWAPWTERLDNPKGLHLYAVRHHGAALLLAGEQGLLLYSSDAGRRFQRLPSPYQGSFFTAEMLSPTEFVVAGLRGQIWHTQDAGQHWQPVHNPVHASITGSAQGADGQLWWVNQAGLVLQQRQGALQPVPGKPQAPLSGVLPLAGGSLLTVGLQGLRLQTVAPASAAAAAPGAQP